jgi:Zn-dependent peptidase ImmA (M78 family)
VVPVEKMAARLLTRHNLRPPYDLEALVLNYATIELHHFPLDADGVTIGIGGEKKPQVLINSDSPETRRKFTLAHELGHIIIPWHTGTIVSHFGKIEASEEYRRMESEANQFAAELLLPTNWISEKESEFSSVENLISSILDDSGASRDAVLIKIFNTIELPIICAELNSEGEIIHYYRSGSSPTNVSLNGRKVDEEKVFSTSKVEERFRLGDRSYQAWVFSCDEFSETDPRPWRDVLNQILEETDSKKLLPNINAILPSKYNSNKDKSESELCSLALQAYDGRGRFDTVIAHPLFPQYVIKRIRELIAKNKT